MILIAVLTVTLAASSLQAQQVADLAPQWRVQNVTKPGSCGHCSTAMQLNWLQEFGKAKQWMGRYRYGERWHRHLERLRNEGIKYVATSDGDARILDYAIRSRRGAVVYWPQWHIVNFQGQVGSDIIILDNNRIRRMERHERNQWVQRWRRVSGCAFVILSGSPPPPVPEA